MQLRVGATPRLPKKKYQNRPFLVHPSSRSSGKTIIQSGLKKDTHTHNNPRTKDEDLETCYKINTKLMIK